MNQLAFLAPTQEQYKQAILSTLFTQQNLAIIFLVFSISLVALWLVRLIKSFLVKIVIAFLIAAGVALFLYFKASTQIRF